MSILERIAAYKREEVATARRAAPLDALEARIAAMGAPRGFRRQLQRQRDGANLGLIGEIKKASPSKGLIRADFDPAMLACAYEAGGATCLSVLTDAPSFQGSLAYLGQVRAVSTLPLLRKDFMLDLYQVPEARAYGADCILLILAMIDDVLARDLMRAAKDYGLDVLVEVHDGRELDRALGLGAEMIGINNRDLKSFETDLNVTFQLAPRIPASVLVVAESGIGSQADLMRLRDAGVSTFLIGESLMRQADVAAATRALLCGSMGA